MKRVVTTVLTIGLVLSNIGNVNAASYGPSVDEFYEKMNFVEKEVIVGYKDVQKKKWVEVEKTGYNDTEVPIYEWVSSKANSQQLAVDWDYEERTKDYYVYPKDNKNGGYTLSKEFNKLYPASRTESWLVPQTFTKKVPYKVKEPIYITYDVYRTKTKLQVYTKKDTKSKLTTKNSKLKTVNVTFPSNAVVIKSDKNWYKGTVSYDEYKKVTNYKTHSTVATSITYYNLKGKKVKASLGKGAAVTKKGSKYSAQVSYTPYKKVKGKWIKQSTVKKTITVSSISLSSYTVNQKSTKKKTVYIQAKNVTLKKEKKKTDEKTITKYKTVKETKYVNAVTNYIAWDVKEQVGTKIEKEPYVYTEMEIVTYTDKEPIYELQQVEKTTEEKYKWVFNNYIYYQINKDILFELLDRSNVKYELKKGYDLIHDYPEPFSPTDITDLMIFDDGSAVNLRLFLEGSHLLYDEMFFKNPGYGKINIKKDKYIL